MLSISVGRAEVIIDEEDYELFRSHTWYVKNNSYIASDKSVGGVRTHTYLHRLLMNAPKGVVVDHKNRNPLDNRRANLRLATYSENLANSTKAAGKSSKYKGVSLSDHMLWDARIAAKGRKVYLGRFATEETAAKAYDQLARKLFGEFASLNFPDNHDYSDIRRSGVYNQTGYYGVDFHRLSGRYNCRYRRKSLGNFPTAEEAGDRWWAEFLKDVLGG